MLTPAGKVSVMVTLFATPVALAFFAVRVKITLPPAATVATFADFAIVTSISSILGTPVVHEVLAVTVVYELAPTAATVTVLTSGSGSDALTV